jgi:hypothetical protein
MNAVAPYLFLFCLLIAACEVECYHLNRCSLSRYSIRKSITYASSKDSGDVSGDVPIEGAVEKARDVIVDNAMKKLDKGLTHIKYNKYAPSAEEAATMTDEQFRGTMLRRMVS